MKLWSRFTSRGLRRRIADLEAHEGRLVERGRAQRDEIAGLQRMIEEKDAKIANLAETVALLKAREQDAFRTSAVWRERYERASALARRILEDD